MSIVKGIRLAESPQNVSRFVRLLVFAVAMMGAGLALVGYGTLSAASQTAVPATLSRTSAR